MAKKKKIKIKIKRNKKNVQRRNKHIVVSYKKATDQNVTKTGEKMEIKKMKKQPTEERIYNINSYIVDPEQGVKKRNKV